MAERILQDTQINQNTAEKADAYCKLGDAYYLFGDVQQALEYHKKHWSIVKKLGDRAEEGLAYHKLA